MIQNSCNLVPDATIPLPFLSANETPYRDNNSLVLLNDSDVVDDEIGDEERKYENEIDEGDVETKLPVKSARRRRQHVENLEDDQFEHGATQRKRNRKQRRHTVDKNKMSFRRTLPHR